MEQQTGSTLDVIYENWRGYHEKLRNCIAPLTDEHLLLQPAAQLWRWGKSCNTSLRLGRDGSAARSRITTKQ